MKAFIKQLFTDKRFKSLLWRATMMIVAFVADFALQNLAGFSLSPTLTTVLGLVLGEISKAANNAKTKPEA